VSAYPIPKRVLDKAVALPLSIVLAPVAAAVVVAMGVDMLVRRRDRGSWLYREPRISRGREFDLLKFRTLRTDVLAQSRSLEPHVRLQEADEANLTWAGRRVLKPWYLDELPQLWNVLRGDMSLVGPRPWPPSLVATQVARGFRFRNEFIAGWTGPAQVAKGIVETSGYAELDSAYVEACRSSSAWRIVRRDLALLRRTITVIARGEGLNY
jgi:lipopolysaccharide/colanic/teichoic acid biosynthesis glycosyltransferase